MTIIFIVCAIISVIYVLAWERVFKSAPTEDEIKKGLL